MRLIETRTAVLMNVSPPENPRYAVLSHRWTKDEVIFADLESKNFRPTSCLDKFWGSLHQARSDGLKFVWIDTCCINKDSSVELSEAINSMYRWYRSAECCYVYLADVDQEDWENSFPKSEWFKRGWTLQELLAPQKVLFFDRQWRLLGDRKGLAHIISCITGIDQAALETGDLSKYSVAQKMSWAARRVTTFTEDSAYCLMGLFDVNMPLLYGEEDRAFIRLQEEIIKNNDDHTIFAWSMGEREFSGLLAPSPACFAGAAKTVSALYTAQRTPFSMTNRGLSIRLNITPWSADTYLAYLDCADVTEPLCKVKKGIFLRRLVEDDQYVRVNFSGKDLWLDTDRNHCPWDRPMMERQIFVRQTLDSHRERDCLETCQYGFQISPELLRSPASISAANWSCSDRTATLQPGGWGLTAVVDISPSGKGLRKIALGFDFDFHPVCLLMDSFSTEDNLAGDFEHHYDWSSVHPDAAEWEEIIEGDRVYRRANHQGIWALRGHRLRGLDVILSESFSAHGSLVTLKRSEGRSQSIWTVEIDNLIGPFRNHNHRALRSTFGGRRNFQHAYGLKMTEEDLEDGDAILKAMFSSLGNLEPA